MQLIKSADKPLDNVWFRITLKEDIAATYLPVTYNLPINLINKQLIADLISTQIWGINRCDHLSVLKYLHSLSYCALISADIIEIKNGAYTHKKIKLSAADELFIIQKLRKIRRFADELLNPQTIPLEYKFVARINMAMADYKTRGLISANNLNISVITRSKYLEWFGYNNMELIWISIVARHTCGLPRVLILHIYQIIICSF